MGTWVEPWDSYSLPTRFYAYENSHIVRIIYYHFTYIPRKWMPKTPKVYRLRAITNTANLGFTK